MNNTAFVHTTINRYLTIILILLIFIPFENICSQSHIGTTTENEIQESSWKGFQRFDLKYKMYDARIIVPNNPKKGNPWIWRARFPDWHTEADSILVSEGQYLAYINTNDKYGSPNAVEVWDSFYTFITAEYDLHKKASLMGVSRGGLFVYNWAKKNPEKVVCIYAEAPVCDFKSWPFGMGDSEGSPENWKRLKKEYGFNSDEEAIQYSNNPIDNLESLAKENVPILHMVSPIDQIVPVKENTHPLVTEYIRLGGKATVINCTEGPQQLQGHHFTIQTPRIVADFIQYHTRHHMLLSPSGYHEIRGCLLNSQIQFERNKKGRVAFLGGSITYNSGWRDSVTIYLEKRFPATEFEFIEAGIPSMGTTPAAFRLERDVLSAGKIDLLFEEAAVNDAANGRTSTEQVRAMEGIIRHLRKANPKVDIIMMHFVDPDKVKSYDNEIEPEVIKNHNMVAQHYDVPTINLAEEVADRIHNEEFSWEDDFKNLHPSPFGQGIYANSIIHFLDMAYTSSIDPKKKMSPHRLPNAIDRSSYDNGHLVDITKANLSENWAIDPLWNPKDGTGVRYNYVDVPMLISNHPGSKLELVFNGNTVGIAIAAGQDAGIIEFRIDGNKWMELNLFTKWSTHLHLPWYYTLASGLTEEEHRLELRVSKRKDVKSKGNFCRIRYFYVNESAG